MTGLLIAALASLFFGVLGLRLVGTKQKWQSVLLNFSGAYLFALLFGHLLPDIYRSEVSHVVPFLLGGFLFQLALDYWSKGIEHGHVHKYKSWGGIYVGLALHAYFEGVPLVDFNHHHHHHEFSLNTDYLMGIMVHKAPIAIFLASFLNMTQLKLAAKLALIVLFAAMMPLGALTMEGFLEAGINFDWVVRLNAFVAGMLVHVATVILYELDASHSIKIEKIAIVILGLVLGVLVHAS